MSEVISSALVSIESKTPVEVFSDPNGLDPLLNAIKMEVSLIVPDISTKSGREEIKSLAHRIAKGKNSLDRLGANLVSDWKEKSKKVDAERRRAWDFLEKLQVEVRKPLTDFEAKEENRIKELEAKIVLIEQFKTNYGACNDIAALDKAILELSMIEPDMSWEEFQSRGQQRKMESMAYLQDLHVKRATYEQEQAELVAFRANEEIRKNKEREDKIAQDAADKAKAEADSQLKQEREKSEKAAADLAEANRKQKEAEHNILVEREKAKKEKAEAEERAKQAAEKAEKDKKEAELRAVESEKLRVQKEKEQEEAARLKRENDLKHKNKIISEAVSALASHAGLNEDDSKKVLLAIAQGQIPHIKISY